MATVKVKMFEPLVIELPELDPVPAGKIQIELPALRVTWGRLDILEAPICGEVSGFGVEFTLTEPIKREMLAELVVKLAPQLRELHREMQDSLSSHGELLDKVPLSMQLAALLNWMRET